MGCFIAAGGGMSVDLPLVDMTPLGKVAVLMGGASAEREVSLKSGAGVLAALKSLGVDAYAFDPSERDLGQLRQEGVSRCFIALHGRHGEDGTVQGALELLGIPYTGSGVMASSIGMDKVMTKRIWRAQGLPTPDWRLVTSSKQAQAAFADLAGDDGVMIIKPSREGSTLGLTKVTQADQCEQAYHRAAQYDDEVLCEQFIQGDEVTCPVLGQGASAYALPVIRIVAPQGNYDYANKYLKNETVYHCPSGLDLQEDAVIQRMVVDAFRGLDCRGWARADIMIRATDRQPFLLEINTSPGMTDHSLVPMSAKAAGMSYAELCLHILRSAGLGGSLQKNIAVPVVED